MELKPSRELLRIYGMQDETGKVCGLMVASQMPADLTRDVIKLAHEMFEKGGGTHIKDVLVKNLDQITIHKEA